MSIELKLDRIYRASHEDIPAQAQRLSDQGSKISAGTEGVATGASHTGHAITHDIVNLGDELVFRLGQVVKVMNTCSSALDSIADNFLANDTEAASWFAQHRSWLTSNGYGGNPTHVRVPQKPEVRG